MRCDRRNLSLLRGFRYSGVRYSGVCFDIFHCNSAGLLNVVRYSGVPLYLIFLEQLPKNAFHILTQKGLLVKAI